MTTDGPGRLRLVAPLTAAVIVLAAAAAFIFGPDAQREPDPSANLPVDAESFDAARVDADVNPEAVASAVVVFSSERGEFTVDERAFISNRATELLADAPAEARTPVRFSQDGGAALLEVPLSRDSGDPAVFLTDLRATASDGLSNGVSTNVTGGVAVFEDLASETTPSVGWLAVTAGAVVGLAILVAAGGGIVRRVSFVLALGVGVASTLALAPVATSLLGAPIDSSTLPLAAAVTIAVGFAFFLRPPLARRPVLRGSIAFAVAGLSPLILLLADNPASRALGVVAAIGAFAGALASLTSDTVTRSRKHDGESSATTVDATVDSSRVTRLSMGAAIGSVVVFGVTAVLASSSQGLSPEQQFLDESDSVIGQRALAEHFPAGASDTTIIAVPSGSAAEIAEATRGVDGVASATEAGSGDGRALLDVELEAGPGGSRALDIVAEIRSTATAIDAEALVGGIDAELADAQDATRADDAIPGTALVAVAIAVLAASLATRAALRAISTLLLALAAGLAGGWLTAQVVGYAGYDLRAPSVGLIVLAGSLLPALSTHGQASDRTTALSATGGVVAGSFMVLQNLPVVQQAGGVVIIGSVSAALILSLARGTSRQMG